MEHRWAGAYIDLEPGLLMDIALLGSVTMRDESGTPLALGGARPRALLALLALESPGAVSADVVLEQLWGNADIQNRAAAMHTTVNRLRKSVGGDLIATVSDGYRLDPPNGVIDVDRFQLHSRHGRQLETLGQPAKAAEAYRRALAEWRGPALSDIREFEFAEQAARQLGEERIEAVESLMSAMLTDGRHDQVAAELASLVDEYPFRERIWELLMLSLYRSGRQAEALSAFQDIRNRLGDELGVDPWPALVDLEERILLHDRSLGEYALPQDVVDYPTEHLDFQTGDTIVEEGAPASSIYWIEEGEVDVGRQDGTGGLLKPTRLGTGRYFGELASLFGTPQPVTVRAATPTTVSLHDLQGLRARLALEVASPPRLSDLVDHLRDLISRGHYVEAHDVASNEVARGDSSPEVRYLAILALARSGATAQARRRYEQFGLDKLVSAAISPELATDIKALAARLDKDMALAAHTAERKAWAERSARTYTDLFERSGEAYHGVNAATMWLLAGESARAQSSANDALNALDSDSTDYWDFATESEAALILGDMVRARRALGRADRAGHGLLSERATTLKQLKVVSGLKSVDISILEPLNNPTVTHYAGHRLIASDGRWDDEAEIRLRVEQAIHDMGIGIAFGSLAAGADIISAESLLDANAELNVVLPFPKEEFVRTSVAPAGRDWVNRFDRCLAMAASVETATNGEYLDDPVLFDFCAQLAMGQTLIRADHLETRAHQIAVWDGEESDGVAGTAQDVRRWKAAGYPSTIIPFGRNANGQPSEPAVERHLRFIVVADFAGQPDLTDGEHHLFHQLLAEEVGTRIDRYSSHLTYSAVWGDRMTLVFDDVAAAARFALEFLERARTFDTAAFGLNRLKGVRIASHAAPVFEGRDPLSGERFVFGSGVSEAMLVESRTPPGEIYTTKTFAALAVLAAPGEFHSQYVGNVATRTGHRALYTLRERRAP